MESSVAFETIGFHALLILNRLRNERRIADANTANEGDREKHDEEEEHARAALELTNRRLARLRARVGEN